MNSAFLISVRRFLFAGLFLFWAAPCFSQKTIPVNEMATRVLVKQARDLLEDGYSVEAIPFLEEMQGRFGAMDDPGVVKARETAMYQLGTCYIEAKRYPDAAEIFQKFVRDFPENELVPEVRFLTLEALAWQPDPAPMQAYIDALKQSGEFDKLVSILRNKTDATRHAVISLLSAYAKMGDFKNLQQFFPFCDEDARSDIGLNMALMEGGDLAVDKGEYLTALRLYHDVRVSTELEAGYDRRLAALKAEISVPLPWVPIVQRDTQLAQRAADTNRYARMGVERANLEKKNYDQDLMMRIAECYDAMERYWNAYVLYQHLYTVFPDGRLTERSRYAAFQCLAALEELPAAKVEADAYLKRYPTGRYRDAVTLGLMQIYLRLNDLPAAEKLGHSLREQKPIHRYLDQVIYLLGYAQFNQQNYEAALTLFQETAETWPDRIYAEESGYWVGMCNLFLGRFADAVKVFDGYLAAPDSNEFTEDVTYRLGMAYYGLEEYETAKDIFQRFLKIFPDSDLCSEAAGMLGDLYGADGEMDQALMYYARARKCAVNSEQEAYALFQAAQVYDLQKRYMELIQLMRDYLNKRGAKGEFAKATLRICKSWRALGKNQNALDEACDAIALYGNIPESEQPDLLFSGLLDEVRNPLRGGVTADEVKARLEPLRAAALCDKTQNVLALRLTALFAGLSDVPGKYAEALLAEKELKLFTPFPLYEFAKAAVARGEKARVQQALDRFLKNYSESDGALLMCNIQIRSLMTAGRMEEAKDLAEKSLAHYSNDPAVAQTHMLAADVLRQMGQYERAAKMYSDFLAVREWRGPLTPQALYWIGVCSVEQGKIKEASAWFQRIYVLYGTYPKWTAKAYAASVDCLKKMGRQDDAVRIWREMISIPDVAKTPEGLQAQAELRKLKGGGT